MSLYQITEEMMELLDIAAGVMGEDGSPEVEAAFAEHAAALASAFDSKADDYAALIRVCETRAEARKAEADRMKALMARDDRLAERLRTMLMDAMVATNRTKVETARFALAVKKNGGKMPVVIINESLIPVDFKVPKYVETLDKDGIREALEAGATIPGASLGVRGTRLDLK